MSSDSDNDSDYLDKMIKTISTSAKKKKSGRKKKSRSSSNKNIKTTYRLGRLVNNDIHADGFTIKLEQSDGKFKFVMHVTFSQKDNPICISVIESVIEQGKRLDQWIWCNKNDINREGTDHTITTKQGEVIPLGKRVQQEDMRNPNAKNVKRKKNSAIYKDIKQFDVQGNKYYIISDDINVGNPFKMYKNFGSNDNVNQVLGLTVAQDSRKPLGMQALDAYINDIVVKKRILTKIDEASKFATEIQNERVQLKSYQYPLKS